MNLQLEKKALKNEIDQLEDEDLLHAIKAILNYGRYTREIWDDESFVEELNRRSEAFQTGVSKHHSWQQVKASARKHLTSISIRQCCK